MNGVNSSNIATVSIIQTYGETRILCSLPMLFQELTDLGPEVRDDRGSDTDDKQELPGERDEFREDK